MATYFYYPNVPNGPDDPADDQPQMQINTASISGIFGEDHITFNTPNGGLHNKSRYFRQLAIPSGLFADVGTNYTKTVSGATELFYTPDASGNEYQMTATNTTNFSKFGNNTVITGTQEGGWSFLPGGLLIQYGIAEVSTSSGGTVVTFPRPFSVIPYSIVLQMERNLSNVDVVYLVPGSASTTQFTMRQTSSAVRDINWIAIGKA